MPIRTSGVDAKAVARLQASLLKDSSAIYNSDTDRIDLGRTRRFTRRNRADAEAQDQAKLTRFAENLAEFNELYTRNSNDYYSLIKNPAFVATLIHLKGLSGGNNEGAKKAVSRFSRYALVRMGEVHGNAVKDEILQVSDKSQMALGLARFYAMAAKNAQEYNQNPRIQEDRKINDGVINSATERAKTLSGLLIGYHGTKSPEKQKLAQDVLTEAEKLIPSSSHSTSSPRTTRSAAPLPAGAAARRRPSDAAASAGDQEPLAGAQLIAQVGATTRARQGNKAAFHTVIQTTIIPNFAKIVPQAKEASSDEEAASPPARRGFFDRFTGRSTQSVPKRTRHETEAVTQEAAQEIRNVMVAAVSDLFKSDGSRASTDAVKARLVYRNENDNNGFDEILDFISAQIKEEGRGRKTYYVDSSSASNIKEASLFLRRMLQAVAQLKVDEKIDNDYINDLLKGDKLAAVIDKLDERNMVKLSVQQSEPLSRFMNKDRESALGHALDLQRALNVIVQEDRDQLAQFAQSGFVAEHQYVDFPAGETAPASRAAAASAADAEANPYGHIYEAVSFEQDEVLSELGSSDGEEDSLDGLSLSDFEGMTLATDELQKSAANLARLLPDAAGADEQTIDIDNGNNEATRYRIFHANQAGAVTRNYAFDAARNPVVISFDRANNGPMTVTNLLEDSANQAQQEVIDELRADYLAAANAQIGQIEHQAAIKLQAGLRGGLTRRDLSREELYNLLGEREEGSESQGVQLEISRGSSTQYIQGDVRYYGEGHQLEDEGGQEVNVQYGIIIDNRYEEVEGRYPYPAVVKSVGANVVLVDDPQELRRQSEVIKGLLGQFKQAKRDAAAQQGGQDLGDFSEGESVVDELDAASQGGDGVVDPDADFLNSPPPAPPSEGDELGADAEDGAPDNNDLHLSDEGEADPDAAVRAGLGRVNSTSSLDSSVSLPNVGGGLDQPAVVVISPAAAAGRDRGAPTRGVRPLNPKPQRQPQPQPEPPVSGIFDSDYEFDESGGEEFSVARSRRNSISSLPDGFHVPQFAAGADGNPVFMQGTGVRTNIIGGTTYQEPGADFGESGTDGEEPPITPRGQAFSGFGGGGSGPVVGGSASSPRPPIPSRVPPLSPAGRGGAASFSAAGAGQVKALSNATKGNIDVSKKTLEDSALLDQDSSGRPIINAQNSELLGLRQNQQKNSFANFGGLIIENIDFDTTNLWMANFRGCDLRNCDFSKIPPEIFNTIKFHGCNIENSLFPQRERGGTVSPVDVSFSKNDVPQQGGVLQEAPNLGIAQLANQYSDFLNMDKDQRDVRQLPLPNNSRNSGVRSAMQRVSSNLATIETPNTEVAQARAEALDRRRAGILDAEV